MATIIEFVKSRQSKAAGKSTTAERVYKIMGTQDDTVAMSDLVGAAPTSVTIGGTLLDKVEYEVEEEDYEIFQGRASYSVYERKQPGESTFNFDISTESKHITNAIATVARYGTTDILGGAIGFDGENIAGTDILFPIYSFTETHTFAADFVTPAYKAALFRAAGKTNNAVFKGFAIGEVLFLGAAGSLRSEDDLWELTYRFLASENLTGISVGTINSIAKKGWEYLWVRYRDEVGGSGIIRTPQGVYVEQVYPATNFAAIAIGTT